MIALQILIITAFISYSIYPTGYESLVFSPYISTLGTVAVIVIYLIINLIANSLIKNNTLNKKYNNKLQILIRILPILSYFAIIEIFNWPALAEIIPFIRDYSATQMMFSLAPFVILYIFYLIILYKINEKQYQNWKMKNFLSFNIKTTLAVVMLPIVFLIFILDDLLFMNNKIASLTILYPFIQIVFLILLLSLVTVLVPFLLKFIWNGNPVNNEIREKISGLLNKTNFKCTDILLWNTNNGVVNAGVAGILSKLRYVFITDKMLNEMSEDDLNAVMAHEIGHAKKGHFVFYFLAILSFMFILLSMEEILNFIDNPILLNNANIIIGLFALFLWLFVFKVLSRNFEREADLYASEVLQNPQQFANALMSLAEKNKIDPNLRSWSHDSIAIRCRSINELYYNKQRAQHYKKKMKLLKSFMFLFVLIGFVSFSIKIYSNIKNPADGKQQLQIFQYYQEGVRYYKNGEIESAIKNLKKGISVDENNTILILTLAEIYIENNQIAEAEKTIKQLKALKPKDIHSRLLINNMQLNN